MISWIKDYSDIIASTGVIAGACLWFIRIQMKDVKKDICELKIDIAEVSAETKTNGGKSIKDQINRLDERTNEADQMRRDMDRKLDKMYGILIDYISKTNK